MAPQGLREAGLDRTVLLVVPGILVVLLLFIYPFAHGPPAFGSKERKRP